MNPARTCISFQRPTKAALHEANEMIRITLEDSGNVRQPALCWKTTIQALSDFTTDIALEPDRPGAYWNRASIHEHLGDLKRAIADYDKVIELHPNPDFARQTRAALMEKLSH